MNDFIDIFPNALSDEICDEAIRLADETIAKGNAEFVDNDARKDYNIFTENHRSFDKVRHAILDTLYKHYDMLADKYMMSEKDFLVPTYKIQKSQAGGGFTGWHTEQGSSENTRSRYLVWMIYLNTVTKGGATEFLFQEKSVQPTKGTLVLWPAAYTHQHRSAPDLQEDKYISTGWFDYRV